MTTAETAQYLIDIIKVYPNYFGKSDPSASVDLWHEVFESIEYRHAKKALVEIVQETDFTHPPINELYKRSVQVKRYEYLMRGGVIEG
mgnify:CR=1 FL=1